MTSTRRVLVIGGGTAGSTAAILLRRAGVHVELIEAKPDWNATTGSGITLQGNALRVLREIGVWEQVLASGYAFDEVGLTAPDGTVLHVQADIKTGGEDLPATVGMQRPQLQQILIDAVTASGAEIRLGVTATSLHQYDESVIVAFSDGQEREYDLVIGADGLNSRTRAMIGIETAPEPTGMAIWRTPAPRPDSVTRTDLAYGGPCYIAGYCPTSETTVYAYLVEKLRDRAGLPRATYAEHMRRLAGAYGGAWPEIAATITDASKVNYTRFDTMCIEGSWHRGRVVLVGDAAHTCPPTLAQGAAMSMEDALVLAELLTSGHVWDDELLTRYYERRARRVRPVLEASVQLGQWQLDGVRDADVPGLIYRTLAPLAQLP